MHWARLQPSCLPSLGFQHCVSRQLIIREFLEPRPAQITIDSSYCLLLLIFFFLFSTGKISEVLSPGTVCPLTKLVLVNAMYFKGKWKAQFDRKYTRGMPFKTNQVEHCFPMYCYFLKVVNWKRWWMRKGTDYFTLSWLLICLFCIFK